jgi:NAD(P)-dependent dehydrogenase (short-subunit alcohol dehydrogenase family)
VVITGGANGIGICYAIRLAAEGATLAIVDREVVAFSEAKA